MAIKYSSASLDEKEYLQIAKNYYATRLDWSNKSGETRHIELYTLVATRRKNMMFTGQSACAILGIPRLDDIEMRPHSITDKIKGSDFVCWRHGDFDPNATIIDGLLVASPVRAVCDLAKFDSTASLLVSINHCLRNKLFSKEELFEELERNQGRRWKNVIKRLLLLASSKCESPLETIAWIAINKAGLVLPHQQIEILDKRNFLGRVDMYWEVGKRKIILELDGKVKYTGGKILFEEKKREDKLRELGYVMIRATWEEVEKGILIKKLTKTKIPKRRYLKNSVLMT